MQIQKFKNHHGGIHWNPCPPQINLPILVAVLNMLVYSIFTHPFGC